MNKRRAKGDGSVFTRKDGRVVGKWTDATGRTRYMTSTKMNKAVRQKLQDRDEGKAHDSEGFTVETYIERWLEATKDTVGLRTYQRSEETARLHITPTLGKVKLDKLTAMQLDGLYRKKLKAGLSPRSAQIIHATAHKMLKQAVRWRMVRDNVAEHATPPKTVREEMQPLTCEQAQVLLKTARKHQPKMYALYALAVTTGARLGELLALQRADVDLGAGTLRISKTVHNGRVTAPKTGAGRRTKTEQDRPGRLTGPSEPLCWRRVVVPVPGERHEHPPGNPAHLVLITPSIGPTAQVHGCASVTPLLQCTSYEVDAVRTRYPDCRGRHQRNRGPDEPQRLSNQHMWRQLGRRDTRWWLLYVDTDVTQHIPSTPVRLTVLSPVPRQHEARYKVSSTAPIP